MFNVGIDDDTETEILRLDALPDANRDKISWLSD